MGFWRDPRDRGVALFVVLGAGIPDAKADGFTFDPDINTPLTDPQIAEGLCALFMAHPRLGEKLTNCFSHIQGGELDLYGRGITARDLADLCTSVAAKPAPGGNIGVTAHNEDGSTVSDRCQTGSYIRRVPIDDPADKS